MSDPSYSSLLFHFDRLDLRIEIGKDGEPWFCAKDVCSILDIINVTQAIENLDDDERDGLSTRDTTGRKQTLNFVSESGLYSLIFQSRKPEAKRFRKWVTAEVLPSIRRAGSYSAPSQEALLRLNAALSSTIKTYNNTKPEAMRDLLRQQIVNIANLLHIKVPPQLLACSLANQGDMFHD